MTIKPPWAFTIWANADYIYAELPAINGHTSHVIKVKNDAVGLSKLLVLARSRGIDSKIGMKGDPTQVQISKIEYDPAMVRRVGRRKIKFTPQQRIGAREILRKLGLI